MNYINISQASFGQMIIGYKHTFLNEYKKLLAELAVEYDERYIFKELE